LQTAQSEGVINRIKPSLNTNQQFQPGKNMPSRFDEDLLAYFTDVEHLRDEFKRLVAAPTLAKRLFVIWGVGGVGKSSLLRMFRLHCKSVGVPVALASGDEAKSALDVLYLKTPTGDERGWAPDLQAEGIALPTFSKTFEYYRRLQARVNEQAQKAQDARERAAKAAGKVASKTAEAAVGVLVGAAAGSVVPGIGTIIGAALGGALGVTGVEALTDWLLGRGFKKPDVDLLLDPAKRLTADFLSDLAAVADQRRIVLMLDTFEQMSALDDWAREVAQQAHPNVLLVVAGRAVPEWDRAWPKWLANAQLEELKPMTEDVMRELVRRYYATMRGGEPDPQQVEAIINFARGLPIVVTSVVQLWVKYPERFGDLKAISPEVMLDLVDRLLEGVPQALIPALEAAAAVRWFDLPVLRAVTGLADVRDVYNELRRFPFVRTRAEGLALHDAVREIMDENLRLQDSERHCELHARAAAYFEKRLEKVTGEEAERLGLERLYHRVRADEEAGIKLFQEMAEELTRYRLVNRLRALLNDANTYPLERESNRLWREYYNARVMHLQTRFIKAEEVYSRISKSKEVGSKLRAYVLCDWGQTLEIFGMHDSSIPILETSLSTAPIDSHLAVGLLELCHAFTRTGKSDKGETYLLKARDFYAESNDNYGLTLTLSSMKYHYLNQGFTRKAIICLNQSKQVLSALTPSPQNLCQDILGGCAVNWAWLLGQLKATEDDLKESLDILQELDLVNDPGRFRDLGYVMGMQGKYAEAEEEFIHSSTVSNQNDNIDQEASLAVMKGFRGAVL
jgi:hypothetical protein